MIFRKLFKRSSSVVVAIDADSKEKAQKIFDDWYEDSENSEELNEVLSERETDTEEWLAPFATSELYDKYCDDDFLIGETHKDSDEQLYDLYFSFECTPIIKKAWLGITLESVLDHLRDANKTYYLKPMPPLHAEISSSLTNNTQVLSYILKRRDM